MPSLPILYRDPRPVAPETHGRLSLKRADNFAFAREANSVALNANEMHLAMRHYPIVFSAEDPPVPIAVLGMRDGENLFVSDAGAWAPGCYVPAYVRRYPFILMRRDGGDFMLAIDHASGMVVEDDSRPLFADGKPAEPLDHGMAFCAEFEARRGETEAFGRAAAEHGLLAANRADVSLPGGKTIALAGFRTIEESRFNALPDAAFLEWRKNGWLPLAYAQLISMTNWGRLADLAGERLNTSRRA